MILGKFNFQIVFLFSVTHLVGTHWNSGVIKFRNNQDFLIELSCILHIRSNLLMQ